MDRNLNCGRMLLAGLAALSLLAVRAQAENFTWRSDLHQAAAESKKLQKPMLLEFTASWCGYCRKMKQTTFRDKSVCRQINGCFVPVTIDADKHQELMKAVHVEYLPTTIVISPQLVVLKRIQGYHTAAQYRKQLGGICRLAKHESAGKPTSSQKNIKPPVAEEVNT
ncbi:MAG: thioredoxin family protein, partial [Planctomycetes bacterium]|nr:thioredoxin family protein [Planctomycetota bacterium]